MWALSLRSAGATQRTRQATLKCGMQLHTCSAVQTPRTSAGTTSTYSAGTAHNSTQVALKCGNTACTLQAPHIHHQKGLHSRMGTALQASLHSHQVALMMCEHTACTLQETDTTVFRQHSRVGTQIAGRRPHAQHKTDCTPLQAHSLQMQPPHTT